MIVNFILRGLPLLVLTCQVWAYEGEVDRQQQENVGTYADAPIVGWYWYNEPQPKEDKEPEDPQIPIRQLPPVTQMKVLQQMTYESRVRAIMQPSAENSANYLRLQNFWTQQAGLFTQASQKALLKYPDLDYNLQHSHYNGTAKLQLAETRQRTESAISTLAGRYGLFFFYRGNDAIDNQLAAVVSQFSATYGISLVPISVDGTRSEQLAETRPDTGQARKMGITHFPALILVEPGSEQYQPLAYGFMTQDDLAKRFLSIATDFAPNY